MNLPARMHPHRLLGSAFLTVALAWAPSVWANPRAEATDQPGAQGLGAAIERDLLGFDNPLARHILDIRQADRRSGAPVIRRCRRRDAGTGRGPALS